MTILSGTQEENKTTHKLVNGGGDALFFLDKYLYKINLVGVILS